MEIWPQVRTSPYGLAVDDCDGCYASQTDIARGSEIFDSGDDNIIGQSESVRHLQFTQNSFVVDSNDDALLNTDGLEHGCPLSVNLSFAPGHSLRIAPHHHRRGIFPLDKADARQVKHFLQVISPWVNFLVNVHFILFCNISSLSLVSTSSIIVI